MIASHKRRIFAALIVLVLVAIWITTVPQARALYAQSNTPAPALTWSRPIPVSGALSGSWYPTLATTDSGQIYLVWGVTDAGNGSTLYESKFDGTAWSRPIDILIGDARSILKLDGRGTLNLMIVQGDNLMLKQSSQEQAGSALGWNNLVQLNRGKTALLGDMVIDDRGVIHAVWFEDNEQCQKCYRVTYDQLNNPDQTTSAYRVISDSEAAPRYTQLVRGADGTLYAMWNVPPQNGFKAGVEISYSKNDGGTWLDTPLSFGATDDDLVQPFLIVDPSGNLVLVYNLSNKDETYYSVSSDQGQTWSDRAPIPGLFSAKPQLATDYFASALDSGGIVHLIAIGRTSKQQPLPGVYHVQWDGKVWTQPDKIYSGNSFAELPAISISNGNKLNVAFTTLDQNNLDSPPNQSYQVWFSSAQTSAEEATSVALPTFTPVPTNTTAPTVSPTPTRRPTPTLGAPDGSSSQNADTPNLQLPLIAGIAPVILILIVVVILNSVLRRR